MVFSFDDDPVPCPNRCPMRAVCGCCPQTLTSNDTAVFEKAFLTYIASAYPAVSVAQLLKACRRVSRQGRAVHHTSQSMVSHARVASNVMPSAPAAPATAGDTSRHSMHHRSAKTRVGVCTQTRFVALMTVLSQHSPNEHFLSDDDQGLVYVRSPCHELPGRWFAVCRCDLMAPQQHGHRDA